jgi:hypothetical protein
MESSNTKNGKYLDSLSKDKKSKILKNIASHYRISVAEAEDEVRDDDAEMLYEYIANDQSLKMNVYNDMEKGKMAKGGKANEKPLSYYKYETKKVKVAWRGKIQPVGMFYSAEEAMKKIKSMASTESEQKEYSIVTPDKTIHLGESYTIRYAKGGKTASPKPKMVRTQFEEEEFEYGKGGNISEGQMKILNALAGYNNGRNLNGILEGMFLSDFKSNKYATEAQTNTVKKNLNSLIKKGFVEKEGLGYSITQEGANYRRSNMAKGGKTASSKPKMVRTQFEEEEFEYGKGGLLSGFNYSIGGL